MRKTLLLLLTLGVFLSFTVHPLAAQDEKKTTLTIVIEEDDEVTVDTSFELKEGQDPEMIKKVVSHLAGEDIHMKISKGKPHGGKKVLVLKEDNGDFTVRELGEDEDCKHTVEMKDHHMVIVTEEGDEEGETKVIVKSTGEDEGDMEKLINVYVTTDEEDCEGKEENVDIYVIKKGDKDVKVVKKKVKVEIEEEK
jgi:hypothetical protein